MLCIYMRKHHEEENGSRNIQILQTRGESQRTVQIGSIPKETLDKGVAPKGIYPFSLMSLGENPVEISSSPEGHGTHN
jgi:hypothetical protein